MNLFFYSIPWNGFIVANIVGFIIFIFILWVFIYSLNKFLLKIQIFRNTYPPEVSRKLIPTITPDDDKCPLSIWEKRRMLRHGTGVTEIRPTIYVFECPLTPGKPLEISMRFCEPRKDIDDLYQVVHEWPKTWFSWLRPDHPRENIHYIFPSDWLNHAKHKVKYIDQI